MGIDSGDEEKSGGRGRGSESGRRVREGDGKKSRRYRREGGKRRGRGREN